MPTLKLVVTLLLSLCASLAVGCSGTGTATGKIERSELRNADRVLTPQRRGDWCWAACSEMALKYNGINDVTQEMLVEKVKGKAQDQTAIDSEIIIALATEPNTRQPDANTIPRNIRLNFSGITDAAQNALTMYSSPDDAVEDFRRGHPMLLGLKNWKGAPAHIVFVTAIEYSDRKTDGENAPGLQGMMAPLQRLADQVVGNYRYSITAIEFYDPMPENGGHTRIEAVELSEHFRFYLSRKKAQEIVRSMNSAVGVH